MIKKLAWDTFKKTGNINTFMELMEVQNLEDKLQHDNKKSNNKDTNKTNNTVDNFKL